MGANGFHLLLFVNVICVSLNRKIKSTNKAVVTPLCIAIIAGNSRCVPGIGAR